MVILFFCLLLFGHLLFWWILLGVCMLLYIGSYAGVGLIKLHKLSSIGSQMFFFVDLESDLIALFLLIFRILFMHLLGGSPVSVCFFGQWAKTTEMEFFVSSKNQTI